MTINESTEYPVFKKGQQLKSGSLNLIVTGADREDKQTRMYLEGSGIFYGLEVDVKGTDGIVTLKPGTAVTSDGHIFALEQEIVYRGIKKISGTNDFDVELHGRSATVIVLDTAEENHEELIQRLSADTIPYLVILVARITESTESNCLYGYENNESKKSMVVEAALVRRDFFQTGELEGWFINDVTEAGDKDPVINRFGYTPGADGGHISFDRFKRWEDMKAGFDEVCRDAEPLIGTAFSTVYELVKEKLGLEATNPFSGLTTTLEQLRGRVMSRGGKQLPWLYDYYRDLVSTYQEFVSTDLFSYLSLMPKEDRFAGYIALHSIRTQDTEKVTYRMGLYRPPFADLSVDALERPSLLMKRLKYLADAGHTRFDDQGFPAAGVRFTPDAGINKLLSERAIPFYYKDPSELSKYWNAGSTRNHRTFNIPGITDEKDRKFLLANMDSYNFFRLKGHTGVILKTTYDAINDLRKDLHLPFDIKVVYLEKDEEVDQLVLERSATFSDLTVILEKIVYDIRCARTCGDGFEERIFGKKFDREDIGNMFEALVRLFGKPSEDLEETISEICNSEGTCNDDDKTCCKSHLRALYAVYEEYAGRKDGLLDGLLFHRFAEKHPGLEHNGGVPKGGTLILVCAKTDAGSVSEEDKDSLVKLLLSGNQEGKAAALSLARELEGYEVVADFCLPYVCCSSQPSINLILQDAPPVARFSITKQTEMPEGVGVRITLENRSLRADSYHWELLDFNGDFITDDFTNDLDEVVEFELKRATGAVFTIVLTASREGMENQFSRDVAICPQGNVRVTVNEKDTVDWDITESNELEIDVTPYGGRFTLYMQQNDTQSEVDESDFDVEWKEDRESATLRVDEPQTAIYFLRYTFSDIQGCEKSEAVLTISAVVPTDIKPAPDTETNKDTTGDNKAIANTDAALNKRILGYRSDVNKMAKEDEALLEDNRWADTKAFLLASGAPEVLHAGYEKLQATLHTGFSKLKAAQKAQVIRMLVYATAYYVDRLVVASPGKVPSIAKKLLKSAGESIMAQKDGLAQWQQVWDATGIVTTENEKTVNTYKGLIA
jgi:hypothetical protein